MEKDAAKEMYNLMEDVQFEDIPVPTPKEPAMVQKATTSEKFELTEFSTQKSVLIAPEETNDLALGTEVKEVFGSKRFKEVPQSDTPTLRHFSWSGELFLKLFETNWKIFQIQNGAISNPETPEPKGTYQGSYVVLGVQLHVPKRQKKLLKMAGIRANIHWSATKEPTAVCWQGKKFSNMEMIMKSILQKHLVFPVVFKNEEQFTVDYYIYKCYR